MLQLELEFLFFILFLLFHFLFYFIFLFWEGARIPPPVVFDAILILFFYSGEG